MDLDTLWKIVNTLALVTYILVKELVLDKKDLRKQLADIQYKKEPLKALEIDLNNLKSKVINLEDSIEQQSEMLADKLDMILLDFKEKHTENRDSLSEMRKDITKMSERLAAVETELKLKPNRRAR